MGLLVIGILVIGRTLVLLLFDSIYDVRGLSGSATPQRNLMSTLILSSKRHDQSPESYE